MHICKHIGLETKQTEAMMALEAAYCELDASKAEYAKLAKSAKQKAKDLKEKEDTLAPESKKKAVNQRNRLISWLLMSSPTHLP